MPFCWEKRWGSDIWRGTEWTFKLKMSDSIDGLHGQRFNNVSDSWPQWACNEVYAVTVRYSMPNATCKLLSWCRLCRHECCRSDLTSMMVRRRLWYNTALMINIDSTTWTMAGYTCLWKPKSPTIKRSNGFLLRSSEFQLVGIIQTYALVDWLHIYYNILHGVVPGQVQG